MIKNKILSILTYIFNFALPQTCLSCKTIVLDYGICGDCFKSLTIINDPKCIQCGCPFINRSRGKTCAGCLKNPLPLIVRSAVIYNNNTKKIILLLKHADGHEMAPFMATAMIRSVSDVQDRIDIIMPVPLHKYRLLKRRFNQSADLGRIIAKHLKLTLSITNLVRIKNTNPQGGKNYKKRFQNLNGAFSVVHKNSIKGKTILLVDDVYTSGATLQICAKTLLKSGAKEVIGVTYSRVIRPQKV